MEFSYTPRQRELKERAAALARDLMIYEEPCEEGRGLPAQSLARIRELTLEARLNAINMPAEWGGQGLSTLEQVIVQEQLGQLTNALWDAVWRPANVLRYCTTEQRERYLIPAIAGQRRDCYAVTEPAAGSDPSLIETVAELDGQGFRISGEKWFVTVGDVADFLIVLALAGPAREPTLFLVDKNLPGVTVQRVPAYMHTFVFEHPEFTFENVRIGPGQVLGEVGGGHRLTREWFVEERLMIAARAIGAAERALRLAADWARERVQFGRRIADNQLIQAMIADSACDIVLQRALTYQVAWEADHAGLPRKALHAKAAMAKLTASEAAGRVIDRAVQIFGGRGYQRDNPVERLYRDIRVDRIWEGTSEIQRLIIANEANKRGLGVLLDFGAGQSEEQREAAHA